MDTAASDKHEEMEALRLPNEFVIPERKFEGQEETPFSQTRRQDSTRFDPSMLSFIVRQWVYKYLISWEMKRKKRMNRECPLH